jgi:hypothetical protein
MEKVSYLYQTKLMRVGCTNKILLRRLCLIQSATPIPFHRLITAYDFRFL